MSPIGLRERKKAETRQAISDAALALAVERGPATITVDDIAAAAGVSARTVFNYFPTKEAAILGLDPDRRRELVERFEARPADETPLEALRAAMRGSRPGEGAVTWSTRARLALDHPQLQSAYVAGFATLEDELTDAVARRVGADPAVDLYPRLVVTLAVTATRVAIHHAIDDAIDRGRPEAISSSIDEAFAALAAGLPGRRPC